MPKVEVRKPLTINQCEQYKTFGPEIPSQLNSISFQNVIRLMPERDFVKLEKLNIHSRSCIRGFCKSVLVNKQKQNSGTLFSVNELLRATFELFIIQMTIFKQWKKI